MSYRMRALKHYTPVCKECGSLGPLQVHHIDLDHSNDELSNLEVLCRPCHRAKHKPTNPKTEMLFVRLKPSVVNDIREAAAADGMKVSAWIRMVLEQHLDLRDRGFEPTIKALMSQPVAPR